MTLFEKIKEAIRLSDKVGRSRGSNCYALDKQAVDRLVVLEIGLEAEIKAALDAKDAEIAALKAERDALRLDAERLDWMEDKTVDTVYFDDGEILDVGGKHATHLRMALDAAIAQAVQP